MSGLEVGGWFVSVSLDILISYIKDQYKAKSNIKKILKILERDLTKIQSSILEADNRRIENQRLKDWLRDLKDAADDAEDVLDMFQYQKLAKKVEKPNKVGKLCCFLKKENSPNDECTRLNEVVDRFKGIADGMRPMIELMKLQPTVSLRRSEIMTSRETTSTPISTKLFGRDSERAQLIQLLLQEGAGAGAGASSSKNVHVLPIVGMGGVGKTTIAQDVYNDHNVKNHFELKAWVCVSDNFDVKRLEKEIIESAMIEKPPDFHNLQNLDRIEDILKQGLTGKRFLIVHDDVWNVESTIWEKLRDILYTGKEGSRVIITTRIQKIADMMGTKKAVTLGGLEYEEFWRFFVLCAFGDENPTHHPSLEKLGKEIVKRLGGNPLAAKTIGAVLKNNFKNEYWREVLNSELSQVDQENDGVMSVLRLSYEYLPSHLKQCFVYCCLFPKDYQISEERLVRLWMANGFLRNEQNSIEKIGETYIKDLLRRSFLHKHDDKYGIHDLLHDLARNLSEGEIVSADDRKVKIPERVRHISIHVSNLSLVFNNENAKKNLRSLVVFDCNEESLVMLKELKGLRVLLICGEYKGELSSESIHRMIHLRYLEIKKYEYRCSHKLPKSVGKLYHLQVLDVGKWWRNPCVLPKETNKLINLHHLEANAEEIVGIGTLILLQKLSFHVKQRESGFEIGQLRKMSQLRRLKIKGLESVESKEQASVAMLGNKEHLGYLNLEWEHDNININLNVEDDDSEVLEGLQLHQNLNILRIKGYFGRSPCWWNGNWPSCLESIILRGCSKWEILPPLGQLPLLKKLRLKRMNAVRRIVTESYGIRKRINNTSSSSTASAAVLFPSLEYLHVSEMSELEELSKVEEGVELFPHLDILSVYKCPKLRGSRFLFPPSQFKEIEIIFASEVDLVRFECKTNEKIKIQCYDTSKLTEWIPWNALTSTEHLIFEASSDSQSPTSIPAEWFQHLTSLRSLLFCSCYKLEFLPSNLVSSLSSLQILIIDRCINIESLPEEGLPTSLQTLVLNICRNIKSLPKVGLPASLQRLRIQVCDQLSELPEVGLPASLQRFLLYDCKKLSKLPEVGLPASLERFLLHDCDMLSELPEVGMPASLQRFRIEYCHKLSEKCRKDGPDWHKISHIPFIIIDFEVVQDLTADDDDDHHDNYLDLSEVPSIYSWDVGDDDDDDDDDYDDDE